MDWHHWVGTLYAVTLIAFTLLMAATIPLWLRPIRKRRFPWTAYEVMGFGLFLVCAAIVYNRGWYATSRWLGNPSWMLQHGSTVAAYGVSAIGAFTILFGYAIALRPRIAPQGYLAATRSLASRCWRRLRAGLRLLRMRLNLHH